MEGWVEVAKTTEIPDGQCKSVIVEDRMLAIVNLAGEFHAIDNICTHAYVELCDGMIFGDRIQCPLHGAQFNIRTGAVEAPPAYEPLKTYPVRVVEDGVLVRVED
ncbi:MAG: non-heme iron oxygenase ferredoxin subunit [Gammaproteobacteria bacterium]|nr:non-heme iron oxygenase ferredoxin subunit [Gammaproteobacteria bacterium]